MKWRVFVLAIYLCGSIASKAQQQLTLLPETPKPQPGIIVGTVVDGNDDAIPGATVTLEGPSPRDSRAVVSSDNGFLTTDSLNSRTSRRRPDTTWPSALKDLRTGLRPRSCSNPANT